MIEKILDTLVRENQLSSDLDACAMIITHLVMKEGYKLDQIVERAKEEIEENGDLY